VAARSGRRLVGMEHAPERRVNAVGGHQQVTLDAGAVGET
jgi:hypothetical protein